LERSSLYAALNGATDSFAAQRGAIRLLGPDVLQDTWKHELILRMVNLGLAVFEVLMNMIINGSLVHLCIFMASWITLAVHIYWLRNQRRSVILAADQDEVQQIGKATARRPPIVAIGDLPYNGKVSEHGLPLHTLLHGTFAQCVSGASRWPTPIRNEGCLPLDEGETLQCHHPHLGPRLGTVVR
jgi:hypothetical protein